MLRIRWKCIGNRLNIKIKVYLDVESGEELWQYLIVTSKNTDFHLCLICT